MNINEEKLVPIKNLRNRMNMDEEKTFTKQYRMNMGEEKSSTKQKYYKHRIEKSLIFFTLVENTLLNLWFIFICVSFFVLEVCLTPKPQTSDLEV